MRESIVCHKSNDLRERQLMAKPLVAVIIPTYNEVLNIDAAIAALFKQVELNQQYNIHAIVTDSSSPDGTAQRVKELAQKHQITLVSGPKEGIGKAYYKAFSYALAHMKPDYIVQMDADLSHPASKLLPMLDALKNGADLALGSRYTQGGFIPGDWPLMRIINSKGSKFVARYIGGVPKEIADPGAGYRAITAEMASNLDLHDPLADGYVFTIKILNECLQAGANIVEIPIHFPDRTHGASKIRTRDIVNYVIFCARMRLRSDRRATSETPETRIAGGFNDGDFI